jgi:radical SAM protein with 4Fe4S-binding SPASM domain
MLASVSSKHPQKIVSEYLERAGEPSPAPFPEPLRGGLIMINKYTALKKNCVLVKGNLNSALYDLTREQVYSLNPTASRIVDLVNERSRIKEIVEEVTDCPEAEKEVIEFLNTLVKKGIARISGSAIKTRRLTLSKPRRKLHFMWLEITPRCNLRCLHCYASSGPHSSLQKNQNHTEPELSTSDWLKIIEDGARIGCRDIQFIGGEPLLKKDIYLLMQRAKDCGYQYIELYTNATRLQEKDIKFLAAIDVKVATTVYSCNQKTHDKITGVKGSYQKTLQAIKKMLEQKIPTRVAVIAMKQNQGELKETLTFLDGLGVRTGCPDPVRPSGRGKDMEIIPDRLPEEYSKITCKPNFTINKKEFIRNHFYNPCWAGKIAVIANGDVLPCIFARDHTAGNLKGMTLKELIASHKLKELWGITKDKVERCKDCEYRYACNDCRPLAYGQSGNLYAEYPRCTYDPYNVEWYPYEASCKTKN